MKPEIVRHGEVILKPETIPTEATLVSETHSHIVAHSETGHHHILEVKDKVDMSKIKVFTHNGDTYIEVPQLAELWHQKSGKDVHTPHKIAPSSYKVILKKEFDYFKGIIRAVRD